MQARPYQQLSETLPDLKGLKEGIMTTTYEVEYAKEEFQSRREPSVDIVTLVEKITPSQ